MKQKKSLSHFCYVHNAQNGNNYTVGFQAGCKCEFITSNLLHSIFEFAYVLENGCLTLVKKTMNMVSVKFESYRMTLNKHAKTFHLQIQFKC